MGIQWLAVYLVSVVANPNHDGVQSHDDLDILSLHCLAIWLGDRIVDEVSASVVFKANWQLFIGSQNEVHVALLVEWVASHGYGVWCLVGVVSVSGGSDEGMLSWVEVFLLYFLHNFPWAS